MSDAQARTAGALSAAVSSPPDPDDPPHLEPLSLDLLQVAKGEAEQHDRLIPKQPPERRRRLTSTLKRRPGSSRSESLRVTAAASAAGHATEADPTLGDPSSKYPTKSSLAYF